MDTSWILPSTLALLVGLSAIAVIRYAFARSRLLGWIVFTGTVTHALAAGVFFSLSWFDLAPLSALHSGDGFWDLAPDARMYYRIAAEASTHGLHLIQASGASPVYISTLAIWMDVAGVHPAAPLLFNFLVFVLTCGLIVRLSLAGAHPTPPAIVAWPLLAWSFSPTLLFCSTQVLKDTLFAALIAATAVCCRALLLRLEAQDKTRRHLAFVAGALLGLSVAVYVIAGIRAYYAMFIWTSLAAAMGLFILRQPREQRARFVVTGAAALGLVWLAFMYGAGPYYIYYRNVAVGTVNAVTGGVMSRLLVGTTPSAPVQAGAGVSSTAIMSAGTAVDSLREGFVLSGGQTNLVRRPPAAKPAEATTKTPDQAEGSRWAERWARVKAKASAVTVGLAAIFVPVSLLKTLGVVDVEGGRGFLYMADLDTLFVDVTLIAVAWLLIRERRSLHHRMYLCFCLVMALLSAVLLAYVVTNFGTLLRLRVIAFVPLWMAPFAIARHAAEERLPIGAAADAAANDRTAWSAPSPARS